MSRSPHPDRPSRRPRTARGLTSRALVGLAVVGAAGLTQAGAFSASPAAAPAAAPGAAATSPTPIATETVPSTTPSPRASAAQPPGVQKTPPVTPAAPPASTTSPTAGPGSSGNALGRALYSSGCAGCHGQSGDGSPRGPSLVGVGALSSDFQLSTGRMPLAYTKAAPKRSKPAYSRAEIDALNSYIASLGPGPGVPQVSPGDLQSGMRLYSANCASCHSTTGAGYTLQGGRYAPALYQATPTQVAEAIRLGPGMMPRFPATALSDAQVNDIATYITTLRPRERHGGDPLGALGPFSEGAVAWIVGLGALLLVVRKLGKSAS